MDGRDKEKDIKGLHENTTESPVFRKLNGEPSMNATTTDWAVLRPRDNSAWAARRAKATSIYIYIERERDTECTFIHVRSTVGVYCTYSVQYVQYVQYAQYLHYVLYMQCVQYVL